MAFRGKREGHLGIRVEETKSRLGLWYVKPSIGLYDNNSTSSKVSKIAVDMSEKRRGGGELRLTICPNVEVFFDLPNVDVLDGGTDKTNITRKPSKTGKHEHGNQKSTKEAKDSKSKPRKVNYGQASVKESQTLVNRSQSLEDKNPNRESTKASQRIATLAIRVYTSLIQRTTMKNPMIGRNNPGWLQRNVAWATRQGLEASSECYK
ncbi:hypothetical protein Tco_0970202 [Tanacetum coccineum]